MGAPAHDTAIVWFRRDLRLADNPALLDACARARRIVPVYIHAPDELAPWAPGAASNWWLHHSLAALADQLRSRGATLHLLRGPSDATLDALIDATGASLVVWNRLYEPQAIARDRQIKAALRARGVEASSHNAALFVEPWTVQTQHGDPYKVFSPFWRAAKRQLFESDHLTACGDAPARLSAFDLARPDAASRLPLVALEALGLRPERDWADHWPALWQPGEGGALKCLERFLDGGENASKRPVLAYGTARERPDQPGTSRLSPHLHFGEIGPRQILAALRERHIDVTEDAEPFFRELGWREFAHHVLFHFPHTPDAPLNPRFSAFPWRDDPDNRLLRAWQRGRTGIPIVDAAMRELWTTGWMHNRARMIVGSFLTKNLRLPWQAGARWFWDTLVDADLAANTLGWQWAAGSGADAAPYFRIFNPILQGEKFDPDAAYVARHVPELAGPVLARLPAKRRHDTAHLSKATEGGHYPRPIIDLKQSRAEALAAFDAIKHDSDA